MSGLSGVIFDLGGVMFDSPLVEMRRYEAELGLPERSLSRLVVEGGDRGAWARHEDGELSREEFCRVFEEEGRAHGIDFSASEMLDRIEAAARPRPEMLTAVERLKTAGFVTAALTNNWPGMPADDRLRDRFEIFVESWRLGFRKPDPRIYVHTCDLMGLAPGDVAYLDDLGMNLKPARELGITTIKVDEPGAALSQLEAAVGIPLMDSTRQ